MDPWTILDEEMKTASSWTFGRHGSVTVPHPMHPASRCWWMFGWSWSISWKSATMLDVFLWQKVAALGYMRNGFWIIWCYLWKGMFFHIYSIKFRSKQHFGRYIKSDHHLPRLGYVYLSRLSDVLDPWWILRHGWHERHVQRHTAGQRVWCLSFGVVRSPCYCCAVCGLLQSSTVFVIYGNMDFEEGFTQIDFFMFL